MTSTLPSRNERNTLLTHVERTFPQDEIIVTKTDLAGKITYANRTFLRISGLSEREAIGAQHNIVRHPDMPRCVYKLLWDRIQAGQEVFAYVVNRAVNGDHYWVFAHVTPSRSAGQIVGYHSSRRCPNRRIVEATIKPLYEDLRVIETSTPSQKEGMNRALDTLHQRLRDRGLSYDQFIFAV